jgi:hypothetical protein
MNAGIVVYQRSGGSLVGKWTHDRVGGVFHREIVEDVADDTWVGDWPVEVFQGDQTIFKGRLRSAKLGDAFELAWQKEDGTVAFQGIGCALDAQMLVGSFEPIQLKDIDTSGS